MDCAPVPAAIFAQAAFFFPAQRATVLIMADLQARLKAAASILGPDISDEKRIMQSRLQRLAFEADLQDTHVTVSQIADLAQLVEKIDWATGDRELVVKARNAKATGESKRKNRRSM